MSGKQQYIFILVLMNNANELTVWCLNMIMPGIAQQQLTDLMVPQLKSD